MTQRYSILPDEDALLKALYKQYRIPTDQYKRRPEDLRRFTDQWNMLTDRSDQPGELLHYMVTERKKGNWPRLGRDHEKVETLPEDVLSEKEWADLKGVYVELGIGSDNYGYDHELRRELAERFATRTGRIVSGHILMAAIEAKRKRGEWVKLGSDDEPFADMDAIAI